MLPPYELEGKTFKRVMKGYNPAEVDEYLDFLIEKYKELYRAYSDLEKSHTAAKAELLTYKENESAIRKERGRSAARSRQGAFGFDHENRQR